MENYRYSASQGNDNLTIGARLIHNFGPVQNRRRGQGRSGNNVNFAINYSSTQADVLGAVSHLGRQD